MTASPSGCCLHQMAAVLSPGTLPSWVPPLLRSPCEPMVWFVPDDSGTQVRLPASPTEIVGVESRVMARDVRRRAVVWKRPTRALLSLFSELRRRPGHVPDGRDGGQAGKARASLRDEEASSGAAARKRSSQVASCPNLDGRC